MSLPPINPGSSPQFQLIPEPAGVPTSITQLGWAVETSDPNQFDVTMISNQDDPSGMTATLTVPSSAVVGSTITFWTVYRNPDGSEVTGGPWTLTVGANFP